MTDPEDLPTATVPSIGVDHDPGGRRAIKKSCVVAAILTGTVVIIAAIVIAAAVGKFVGHEIYLEQTGTRQFDDFEMSADGSNQRCLTKISDIDSPEAWSPDGGLLVVSAGQRDAGDSARADLWIVSTTDKSRRKLTEMRGYNAFADWSPKGQTIAFQSAVGDESKTYLIDTDGSHLRPIPGAPSGWSLGAPSWSPDGEKLAVSATNGADPPHIFIFNLNGAPPIQVTYGGAIDTDAAWSPTGDRIAFFRRAGPAKDEKTTLSTVAVTGTTQPYLVAESQGQTGKPSWSPDGRYIAFARPDGLERDIFVTRADGLEERRLTDALGWDDSPVWSPDGKRIAFRTDRRRGCVNREGDPRVVAR